MSQAVTWLTGIGHITVSGGELLHSAYNTVLLILSIAVSRLTYPKYSVPELTVLLMYIKSLHFFYRNLIEVTGLNICLNRRRFLLIL